MLSLDPEGAVLPVPSQEGVNGDLCGRDVPEGGEGKSGSRDRMAVTAPWHGEELAGMHLPLEFPQAAQFAATRVEHGITAQLELFKLSSLREAPKAVMEGCDYNI